MTDTDARDTLRQMLADWDAATPEQREAALAEASAAAQLADPARCAHCPDGVLHPKAGHHNTTPLTGKRLEQPDPAPPRRFAQWYATSPCAAHQAAYTGTMPCTGVLRCSLCGTEWDPDTGKLLSVLPRWILTDHGHPAVIGRDLRVGDDLEFLGTYHRITEFKPYTHPTVTNGEQWRIAYARRSPTEAKPWGMTIWPDGTYRISQPAEPAS